MNAHITRFLQDALHLGGPKSAIGKRLAPFFGFILQLISKTLHALQDGFARRFQGRFCRISVKASCNIILQYQQHNLICKTVRRFSSLRREIYMRAHTRPYGGSNSKKTVLHLACSSVSSS